MMQVSDSLQLPSWGVSLSSSWNVLGPFPIHAREQHFLSPSYPLNLSDEIDFMKSYPSSLLDNGSTSWGKFSADPKTGTLDVSYSDVRWSRIRKIEGWAGLQHHSVLHTVLTVFPPSHLNHDGSPVIPRLHVNLLQGSFFTILPKSCGDHVPKWYSGNIYSMERSPPRMIDLPSIPSLTSPTTYDVFVSGDYEIRLFGDPQVYNNSDTPTLTVTLTIRVEPPRQTIERLSSFDVAPDFIDGWAFGGTIGIFLRNHSPNRRVIDGVTLNQDQEGFDLRLLRHTTIWPSQVRVIPVEILQSRPFREKSLEFTVHMTSPSGDEELLAVSLSVTHLPHWSYDASPAFCIKSTYLYSEFTPTAFLVKPPLELSDTSLLPVVALHGAAVDIFDLSFWRDALPRQARSWTIIPSGRTSWGLDWHGPSAAEVWHCVESFGELLGDKNHPWASWSIPSNTRVVIMGHSNGGQGAWHIAGRFPDRIAGVVAAAGYVKSQAYVPLTQSHAQHFMDPALNAILETSMTPDDNDLFLSNIGGTPILAVHGGDDENVPTWHTRSLFNTLKSLHPTADITLKEDPSQPHWYDVVFDNEVVQSFVQRHTGGPNTKFMDERNIEGALTLTVAVPAESDTLCGLRIEKLSIPGRLGKLRVSKSGDDTITIHPTNVRQFTIAWRGGLPRVVDVEGEVVTRDDGKTFARFSKDDENTWKISYPEDHVADIQPSGRLSLILSSKGTLLFVVPDEDDLSLSHALRLAHDLDVYHKLDVDILTDTEAGGLLDGESLGPSNVVIFDGPKKTSFGRRILGNSKHSPLPSHAYRSGAKSNGSIFLYKHPTHPEAVSLFLRADDEIGMENVLRLFPMRTGVFGPDWMVVSPDVAMFGAAGVTGAGLWADNWEYCGASSWSI
ncbi:hypothetical protein BJ322DRAFT_1027120 [Thelephora terrestris]|uniref:Peptidase S9 prolyl oligopeptidase catalytic domain-containing protein n=1 Tax=Thelephora terrestris TaxID=56493 RepID=A0A9P6HPF0_9AGAM|nr:hypothetical protein BJ322DRAFT_1027120 [Thelephora terrestris]